MCGIHGIVQLDGAPVSSAALTRMGAVTVHRGPDDEGVYAAGSCAIGMRRLSIIDLAGGHQPLSNRDGTLWLVCNGEVYNFRELRQDLESRGHVFTTGSDCETLIHLYAEYGDDFLSHVNGMFAFALWDVRRRRLILGRDRLGIKPLYVRNDGRQLAFASEVKSLLTLPGFDVAIDPAALTSYLQLGYVPTPQSMFKGVQKLPPATWLSVEDGRVTQRRYWRVPTDIERGVSEQEWIERIRERLERAVQMQMVSDVPIGAFLSGGIDSSAVVAFMARACDRPIRTYAIGFSGGTAGEFYNELPYAAAVARKFGTDHQEIVVRPDVIELLPRLLWHMDEPIADMAFVTTYLIAQFARRDVTVILSGVGGDELFGGYRRYLGSHYHAAFQRFPRWLQRGAVALGARLPADRHSPLLNTLRLAKGFLASVDQSFEERYRAYVQVFSPEATQSLMCSGPSADSFDAVDSAFVAADSDDVLNRMLVVDAETQLPDDLLLLTDKMTMAASLECRVPLLDHELVELAARMPQDVKVRGGRLKHAMKEAMAGVLPAEILDRQKRGFGLPMGAWLKDGLRPVMDDLLSDRVIRSRGLFDGAQVRQLMSAHRENRVDATDPLLTLINLEIWSRIYLDRRSPQDVASELTEVLV